MGTERGKATPKKRRKRSPKQCAAELAIEKRREKATKLRLAGWSVRDIAAHLKVGVATAHSDITAVLERTQDNADESVKRERAISLARLDVATKGIWPSVESGDLEAVDRLVKLEARRAKVVGFDAADKSEISGPNGGPLKVDARQSLVERLAGLVAGEPARAETPADPRGSE